MLVKQTYTQKNNLNNQSEVEEISLFAPTVVRTSLPFPKLTAKEISRAIRGAGDNTPRKDKLPTAVLNLARPYIVALIVDLFQAHTDNGHHQKCFHTVFMAVTSRLNRLIRTDSRSYKPIAILSALGKGMERLVVGWMSWTVIKHKVLTKQKFGALPLKSSVDLVSSLTRQIEVALAKDLTATVATLNIKGAFDTVLPGRLIRHFREQE